MKLYSDTLTERDLYSAATVARVRLDADRIERPRKRASGWTFRLRGTSNRYRNSGTYGAESVRSASWDQHGRFFAAIFEADPNAIIGSYIGRDDFHDQTEGAYLPEPEIGPTDEHFAALRSMGGR